MLASGRLRWLMAGLMLPVTFLLISLYLSDRQPQPVNKLLLEFDEPTVLNTKAATVTIQEANSLDQALAKQEIQETKEALEIAADPSSYTSITVRSGDTLDRIFRRNNLSISDLHKIMKLDIAKDTLGVVRPGDTFEVWHREGNIEALHHELSIIDSVAITRQADSFVGEIYKNDVEYRRAEASGIITDSLFLSATNAGISDRLIMNMADLFAWDIDFVLDIRNGDEFVVIYEELWRDGKKISEGEILAAEFVNRGKSFRALRYEGPDGRSSYYTPDGRSVRKAFLRAPLAFSRISSNFNPNRRHPVLNTLRAHKGVDYAAARGTPIKAAGDGKVEFKGNKGGYGKVIILAHGSNITTLYAHMDSFNRNIKQGGRVQQGQIIGYVGSSGLATGPHLHYEYRKNGVHRNPRTVELPQADPIDPAFKADFQRSTAAMMLRLDSQRQLLASNTEANETL
jgi:murein DD-endopeptidase MepM/ murein hydrolase activator NlpD